MSSVKDLWTRRGPTGRRVRTSRWGRGNRWQARWVEHGRRVTKTFPTKDAARAHLEDVGAAQRAGTHITADKGAATVGDVWPLWLAARQDRAPKTRASYSEAWARIGPAWGHVRCRDVSGAEVAAWLTTLHGTRGPLGASARRQTGIVLRGVLELAVEERIILANPVKSRMIPRVSKSERRYLSVAELDRLEVAMPDTHTRLVVRVLARTGVRPGEAFAWTVGDLDAGRGRLAVTKAVDANGTVGDVKTHEHREVPVGGVLLAELVAASRGRLPAAPLLHDHRDRAWTRARWRPIWRRYGPDGLTTYELRHTAASLAIHAGANVMTVQRMLGHASAAVTLSVYSHLWDEELDVIPARVDAWMDAQR